MTRAAVFASGSGSNLQAILDHQYALGDSAATDVVLVASDHATAGALTRARKAGIVALALDRDARTTGLASILSEHRVDLIVLAGYLRLVPADVVSGYRGRILNVHPALLPAFGGPGMYGHHVHEAVLASGARLTGPTVHFVDERYDEGPVIAQTAVPIRPGDTPDELAQRVLEAEHGLYPRVVEAVAAGRIRLGDDNRVIYDGAPDLRPLDVAAAASSSPRPHP
jgi:formyltetrahydrofolate-dependent phosphoribosylglycinamide formyltransferase